MFTEDYAPQHPGRHKLHRHSLRQDQGGTLSSIINEEA